MNEESIQAISFQRSDSEKSPKKPKKVMPWVLGLLLLLLLGLAGFVMWAQQISIQITPSAESIQVKGGRFPVLQVGDSILAWPGEYELLAECRGYENLQTNLVIERRDDQKFEFSFHPLPGELQVMTDPELPAQVFHEETLLGESPGPFLLMGNTYALRIVAKDYLPVETNFVVQGLSQVQKIHVTLTPAWSLVRLDSDPQGATLQVGDEILGKTPVDVELFKGDYTLRFKKTGFEEVIKELTVEANTPVEWKQTLAPAMGLLTLESIPDRVGVQIDGQYRGQTPLTLKLTPDEMHKVLFLEPGYAPFSEDLSLGIAEERILKAELKPLLGRLRLSSVPAGAEVSYKGTKVGVTPMEIELPCIEQQIEFRAPGYEILIRDVQAKSGPAQRVHVNLIPGALPSTPSASGEPVVIAVPSGTSITAANGYVLSMIPTGKFMMGSSRREQGRRSNENLFEVELKRPVYFGTHEVSNEQFEKFDPSHSSGLYKKKRLHGADQPVSAVTWEQAVAYCNWMSEAEGLPLAYKNEGEKWFALTPLNTGYRLPTEAEWEYCARHDGKNATRKYPWSGGIPPTTEGGNLADAFARSVVSRTMKGYSDGQSVSSAVGSYPASPLGLYDLSGNVSEWCHDSYQIAVRPSAKVDPAGTGRGGLHLIRGSSWKQSSITQLRCAARDYGDEPRVDLGFRVVRYAH